jgi:hypothetical protein
MVLTIDLWIYGLLIITIILLIAIAITIYGYTMVCYYY